MSDQVLSLAYTKVSFACVLKIFLLYSKEFVLKFNQDVKKERKNNFQNLLLLRGDPFKHSRTCRLLLF